VRRFVLATALLLTGLAVPRAGAAPVAPEPTLRVTVTNPTGKVLVKTAKVRWKVSQPGKFAELFIDNTNLPATTTTIDAVWTSAFVRIYKDIKAVSYTGEFQRTGIPTGTSTVTYGLRFRPAGKPWSPWRDTTLTYPTITPFDGAGSSIVPVNNERLRYQFQVRLHIVIDDVNRETQTWLMRANN
jgi:hypothetical protein